MDKKFLWYLASPYTHQLKTIKEERCKKVTELAVKLLNYNVHVFSPIAYNAPWEVNYSLPSDWGFWEEFDKNFISRCDGMIVYCLDGWTSSTGINSEIKYIKHLNEIEKTTKPIIYIQEGDEYKELFESLILKSIIHLEKNGI